MKLDLLIFMLETVFQASWSYYASNSTSTWSAKRDECKVATPKIQYGDKKLTVNMYEETIKQDVWVGYYVQNALLEYIGCMATDDLSNMIFTKLGETTPGLCFSACSHSRLIGIKKHECYCIPDKPDKNIRQQDCNAGCVNSSNAACGADKFISIYRMLSHNNLRSFPRIKENKYCLQMKIDKTGLKTYEWTYCSDQIWAFCTSDNSHLAKVSKERNSWRDAATSCFHNHGYPIGYDGIQNVNYTDIDGWTGIAWSDVIYNENDYREDLSDIRHGYLKYENTSKYVLNFSKNNTGKYILCNDKTEGNESTESTTIFSDEHSVTENMHGKYKDVTVVVSTAASATLLVVVTVIILILVQRKQVSCCTKEKQSTDVAYIVDVEGIEAANKINYNYYDSYALSEQDKDVENTNETSYDIVGSDLQKPEKENVYNNLKSEDIPIYDHTNDKSKNKLQAPDNTYNTAGDMSLISASTHAGHMNALEESLYSNSGASPLEIKQSDNVYNTLSVQ